MIKKNELLMAVYELNRLPVWHYNIEQETISDAFYDYLQFQVFLKSHIISLIQLESTKDSNRTFNILSYLNEVYGYFHTNDGSIIICGPIRLSDDDSIRDYTFSANLNAMELKELLKTLPVMNLHSFSASIRLIMLIVNEDALPLESIESTPVNNLNQTLNRLVTRELFDTKEVIHAHTPYTQELLILNCIREGNLNKLISLYRAQPPTRYGVMSKDPLKQALYGGIANVTLITRYAIEGGLEEETAYTLSDVYIKKMEQCQQLYEIELINEKMALDFTTRVNQSKFDKINLQSIVISKCLDYIQQHLHEKISLPDIAKSVHLTPKYLSWLFKHETQKTLTSVIESSKIEEAKRLLAYTDYAISFISDSLAFHSQSYFTVVFKRHSHQTPKQYRSSHQNIMSTISDSI